MAVDIIFAVRPVGQRNLLLVRGGLFGTVLLVLALESTGCRSSSAPSAPSPVPQATVPPIPVLLIVFTDFATGFSTSDVRDAEEQIVRFNTAGELIWTPDDMRFRGYAVIGGGEIIGPGRGDYFQVRFGTRNGEQRAYLGQSDNYCHCPGYPPTLADLEVVGGQLIITWPGVPVPGT